MEMIGDNQYAGPSRSLPSNLSLTTLKYLNPFVIDAPETSTDQLQPVTFTPDDVAPFPARPVNLSS